MDPYSVDDIVVHDYTMGVAEIVALSEITRHFQDMVHFVLPSTQPTSCMHMRFFPSLTPDLYNFFLHVPLIYKTYRKYSLVLSCTSTS
jgi:hypothetical protein